MPREPSVLWHELHVRPFVPRFWKKGFVRSTATRPPLELVAMTSTVPGFPNWFAASVADELRASCDCCAFSEPSVEPGADPQPTPTAVNPMIPQLKTP